MKLDNKQLVEVGGFIAVAASLIFVGLQLMMDRQVAVFEINRDINNSVRDLTNNLISDQEVTELWQVGLSNFHDLNSAEKIRFSYILGDFVLTFADALTGYEQGILPEVTYRATGIAVARYLNTPGGSSYWELSRVLPRFYGHFKEAS